MIACSLLACVRTNKVTDAPSEERLFMLDIEAAYENPQVINLSEFVTNITYIPLETKEDCMIRSIHQILFSDEYIFVSQFRSVYQFTRDGKFLRQIGAEGRGPEEFVQINNISLDLDAEVIYIHAGYRKSLIFDFNGKFLRSIKLSMPATRTLTFGRDKLITHYPDVPSEHDICDYLFYFSDSTGNFLKKVERKDNITATQFMMIGQHNLYKLNGDVYFKDLHNDTIFKVFYDSLVPHIVLDFGKYKLDKNIETTTENVKALESSLLVYNVVETPDHAFIRMSHGYGGRLITGWFSKANRGLKIFSDSERQFSGFLNDIDGGYPIFPVGYNQSTNDLIFVYNPLRLKEHLLSEDYSKLVTVSPDIKGEFESWIKNMDESSNPIIGIATLKK
jgi:hypothetical protein